MRPNCLTLLRAALAATIAAVCCVLTCVSVRSAPLATAAATWTQNATKIAGEGLSDAITGHHVRRRVGATLHNEWCTPEGVNYVARIDAPTPAPATPFAPPTGPPAGPPPVQPGPAPAQPPAGSPPVQPQPPAGSPPVQPPPPAQPPAAAPAGPQAPQPSVPHTPSVPSPPSRPNPDARDHRMMGTPTRGSAVTAAATDIGWSATDLTISMNRV